MTPLQLAQNEWECETTLHPKQHFYENGKKQVGKHQFRKLQQAIALLNWCEYIEITKLEKLPNGSRGAAIPLVKFLKSLADKYHIRIFGHVKPYKPDPPCLMMNTFPHKKNLSLGIKNTDFIFAREASLVLWRCGIRMFLALIQTMVLTACQCLETK